MKNKRPTFYIILVFGIIFFIMFISSTFKIIQPGEKAIVFRPYGSGLDKDHVFGAGLQIIAPWNDMIIYDVRESVAEFSKEGTGGYKPLDVLDKNGLTIEAEVTVRFFPVFDKIGNIHEIFGKSYIEKLVIPEVRSSVRKVMGRYSAEQIYSTHRKEVEDAITQETIEILSKNNIAVTAMLIRSIILPLDIKTAIEKKLKQEQEALAYQFILEREKSEAERKKIEAEGTANFNRIISASLTDNVLQQKGIDATLELVKSPNTKVVIVGNSKNGLPLILGDK